MKFKRIHIPFKALEIENNGLKSITSAENEDTKLADEIINELIEDGWIIASTSSLTSSKELISSSVFPYTSGIEVFLMKIKDNIEFEPNQNDLIQNLPPFANEPIRSGIFQMPDSSLNTNQKRIFFKYWIPKWGWDGTEANQILDESGRAIRTYLISLGLISNIPRDNCYVDETFNSRKAYLDRKIDEAFACIDEATPESKRKLFDAFNAIQLWGGKMGKSFYYSNTDTNLESRIEQGLIIVNKWNDSIDSIYRRIVQSIKNGVYTIENLEELFDQIEGIGVAFATKHLNFWTCKANSKILPIYDSFIYRILFAKESGNPDWRKYTTYVDALEALKVELNDEYFTITNLERGLFAYCKIVGIKQNNKVNSEHSNIETETVNAFINKRLSMTV